MNIKFEITGLTLTSRVCGQDRERIVLVQGQVLGEFAGNFSVSLPFEEAKALQIGGAYSLKEWLE
jgi:hypothetical protein